jgi:hypothetical protein
MYLVGAAITDRAPRAQLVGVAWSASARLEEWLENGSDMRREPAVSAEWAGAL